MSATKPNVLLINCDDLGYGDLGCYGSRLHHTPVLDTMAEEGKRWTNFYMASPVCSPSRGAMMTGCYPKRIGFGSFDGKWVLFPGQGIGLHPDEITLGKALQQADYATMLIGKWHCGDQPAFLPTEHGFDHYYGLPYSNDMGRQVRRGDYPPLPLMLDDAVLQEQPDQTSLTERYIEQAVRFMRSSAEADKPFFLYLAHMYVHLPLYVPQRFLQQSRNGSYGAAVECVDWATGVLLDELKRLGLDDNTLVIFTSDNGSRSDHEGSNGPLRGKKGTTWEGGMRVPCIMRWPGRIPAGEVCESLTASLDLYPTLIRLAGGDVPQDRIVDGVDIRELMFAERETVAPRQTLFYYLRNNLEAVRDGNWKLHVWRNGQEVRELYDLAADVGETNNVAEAQPEVVARLEQLLHECRLDLGDDATGTPGGNCREPGRVEQPDTLTHYRADHPYIIAMYDIEDKG
ncbi:sulfatase family protein [Paenibacillus cymbidii]|uniref:sulfatase family protein n=1 Tax=Paenibacillus cymbidii TaxID=1639034 RepID=UPI0010802D3D|nr:sulfatase [Paenibacillus cymbidii]